MLLDYLDILNYLVNPKDENNPSEFLMEVTDKTMADVKVSEKLPFACFIFIHVISFLI